MTTSELKKRREIAVEHRDAWLKAELEVTTNQSYTIGSRSLTRASLKEIRDTIAYWDKEVDRIDNLLEKKGRSGIYTAIPRDL